MMGEKVWNTRVWKVRHLRPYQRLTLLAMTHLADMTGKVTTTPRKIAHMVNCDLRTIQNATKALKDDGLIQWVDCVGGRGRDNTYKLTL